MEECYALLGISPTMDTEEIEKAYQEKKRGLAPDSLEHSKLDKAYNDAIMATFAPIKVSVVQALPPVPEAPAHMTFDGPAAEPPVSFSDEQLLNMDIGELRESYEQTPRSVFLTWGIEDRLLRCYVMAFAGFVVIDLIVSSLGGSQAFNITGAATSRRVDQMAEIMSRSNLPAFREGAQQLTTMKQEMMPGSVAPPSGLAALLKAFVVTVHYFFCSLPMPIVMRFFIKNEPISSMPARLAYYSFFSFLAAILFFLTRPLLGSWVGSAVALGFASVVLSSVTLSYEDQ
jgi:hypothetical protein